MRFESRQRIAGTVEEVERAMLDPRYPAFLLEHHGVLLEVQQLEREETGDVVRRRVRYRARPVIRSVGPKPVPPEYFAFVETSHYDRRTKELTFSNTPTTQGISRMLVNTGVLRLRDAGGGHTERVLDGEIALKLPFLLKPLAIVGEQLIRTEGLRILEGEAPVLGRFIQDVLRQG